MASVELTASPAVVLPRARRRSRAAVRRGADVAIATSALVLLAPFALAISAAILLEGTGGVLFLQTRVGRDGRRFRMVKFRSMAASSPSRRTGAPLRQDRDDPRCTRVGRVLRRTHLDELPQLVNVLAGHMTLIGPRPLVPEEDALVSDVWDERHAVVPGITGAWQVARSSQTDIDELVRLDHAYLAARSLRGDVAVLVRTVGCVARRTGS
jgi:lipopolysaccharide/colanic/teichoic acid biosynthesis glycosyltransferase